jgi:hypothetical protein
VRALLLVQSYGVSFGHSVVKSSVSFFEFSYARTDPFFVQYTQAVKAVCHATTVREILTQGFEKAAFDTGLSLYALHVLYSNHHRAIKCIRSTSYVRELDAHKRPPS